ncbi:DUF485 domain-containing protein [Streptomyces sp. NPDC003691]
MGTTDSAADGRSYTAVYDSVQFTALRRRSNAFTLWASVTFLGWWFLTILLAAFTPEFFRQELGGPVTVGLLFVLLTFALVVALPVVYLRYACERLDPLSERIRADLEGDSR